jgi:hypothetical protein
MSDIFLQSNKRIDEAVQSATDHASLRENMLLALEQSGSVVRPDPFNVRLAHGQQPDQPAVVTPVSPAQETHSRIFYPRGNDRFEIWGGSEEELNAKEAKIRGMLR